MTEQSEASSQAGQEERVTIQDIKGYNVVNWIVRKKPELKEIESDIVKKFKHLYIVGSVFLNHDGDTAFFQKECSLPSGVCEVLAELALETKGKKSKCCCSTSNYITQTAS